MFPTSSRNNVPPCAFSSSPSLRRRASGKGALFVAEQFALQQRVGQGGAVEFHQRVLRARAGVVDRLGQNFFSRPALALNQNGGTVAFGGLAGHLQHLPIGGVPGDNFSEVVAALFGLHRIAHPHVQRQHFAGAADGVQHVGNVKGLDQVVVSAQLHRLHGAIHHVVSAHHQHYRRAVSLLDLTHTSIPSMPGSTTSTNANSVASSWKSFSPSSPDIATRTS